MTRKRTPLGPNRSGTRDALSLEDGSRVAVVGGGPAGSLFAYFVLEMADRAGLELEVDVYEPRDFEASGPAGCNMCGGIISETLVQNLAAEGINLPTPLHEKRIAAVHRGGGPRDLAVRKWESFDQHLLTLAANRGANVVRARVEDVTWNDGRPELSVPPGSKQQYDLMAVAVGVNSPALKLFQNLDVGYEAPASTKTFIREYFVSEEVIGRTMGSSMHVFLLNIPRIEFAAIVPKGDYLSVCILGESIDKTLIQSFLDSAEVRACMPDGWEPEPKSCQCAPRINVNGSKQPFADRIVFIGDCGVTRLYKDGIGAAYRTAKAAAVTAVFQGIGAESFRRHYLPECTAIRTDNFLGKMIFAVARGFQSRRFARRALVRMAEREQRREGEDPRHLSQVLWDMFTGSAPYREIVMRSLRPAVWGGMLWSSGVAFMGGARQRAG
jgi:flavin-dependent dehydrogenase